jgi:hypothetical protein
MRRNKLSDWFLLSCLLFGLFSCSHKQRGTDNDKKLKNIVETGELAAVSVQSFALNPFPGGGWYNMTISGMLEHGTIVNAGDSIVQFDPSSVQKEIIDAESRLETELAAFEKLQVDHDNKINDLTSKIKTAMASFELKKTSMEASHFEPERKRKIKELEFEQEKINLAKEKKRLELNIIANANELKIQQIRLRQVKDNVENSYNALEKFTLRTPTAGVFQIAQSWNGSGGLLKIGDEIYFGMPIANVPDLTWMKVNTCVNENDFLRIHEGQKVAVRLDALSKVIFDGEISYIGKLCHRKDPKSKQKIFDVEVKMLNSDLRLKPGMTVSCEYLNE